MTTNSIFNNTLSNTAQKFLDINTRRVGQSIERISSGIRVNRAADDVAGLAAQSAEHHREPQSEKVCSHSRPSTSLSPPASSTKR